MSDRCPLGYLFIILFLLQDTASLLGTTGTATANGDYFDIQWISNESIDDELHAYRITVVTRTTSTVIDKEVTFGKCCYSESLRYVC